MRAVVQRVTSAEVRCFPPLTIAAGVDREIHRECIGAGLVVLVAAHVDDTEATALKMADRVFGLRIFADADGKMNLSLKDLLDAPEAPAVLAVSNFTLYGETAKNRRPSFIESAPYDKGEALYGSFLESLRGLGCPVKTGVFGAHMELELVNDGPVTVILEA